MALRPVVDEAACALHGDCAEVAPAVFRIDDVAVVIGTGPDDLIMEAAASCPSVAISVFDDSGAQVYP